jgi:hypothetical protein
MKNWKKYLRQKFVGIVARGEWNEDDVEDVLAQINLYIMAAHEAEERWGDSDAAKFYNMALYDLTK